MKAECLTSTIVYKATVTSNNERKEYTGLTEGTFKQRYNNHQQSIRHRKYESSTELSKHVWALTANNQPYSIEWKVHRRAAAYNKTKRCNLCLAEKLAIFRADNSTTLNKRSELVSKYRHHSKFYLSSFILSVT